jgi:hypothetical protein
MDIARRRCNLIVASGCPLPSWTLTTNNDQLDIIVEEIKYLVRWDSPTMKLPIYKTEKPTFVLTHGIINKWLCERGNGR